VPVIYQHSPILAKTGMGLNREFLQRELEKKGNNAEQIAEKVLQKLSLIPEVLLGISSASSTVRFKCAKILSIISQAKPDVLYSNFEFFENLLDSKNNIIKWNAIDIIANLTKVDDGNKFDCIFNKYYKLLNEGSLITAAHVVENSGKIARAKPYLKERIVTEILRVMEIPLPTSECRNIIAGKAITIFSQCPELAKDKPMVISFVTSQLNSTRNATKKKAEAFLRRLTST
jgi:hypothetical protein